jgi:hypothetical protein
MTMEDAIRRGVVDRVVDGTAVVLDVDDAELHLPLAELPEGAGEGSWLLLRGSGEDVEVVGLDTEGERHQREDVAARLARLRRTRRPRDRRG